MWICLFLFLNEKYKLAESKNPNIGTSIDIIFTIGKVSPSEYKYSFQLPATTIKSENAKENMLQNSEFRKVRPNEDKT